MYICAMDEQTKLVPFDLELAKQYPLSVRAASLTDPGPVVWFKPKEVLFFESGKMAVEWEDGRYQVYDATCGMECFRIELHPYVGEEHTYCGGSLYSNAQRELGANDLDI